MALNLIRVLYMLVLSGILRGQSAQLSIIHFYNPHDDFNVVCRAVVAVTSTLPTR